MKETLSLGRTEYKEFKEYIQTNTPIPCKIFSHLSKIIPVFLKQSQVFQKGLQTPENKFKLDGSCC